MSDPTTITTLSTYRNETPYPFCPGCGHGPILDRLTEALVLLERVGLADVVNKKVGEYSRGMRQRLGIADVLVKEVLAPIIDGKGGGRPESASAGGKNPARLAEALETAREAVRTRLDGGRGLS